VLGGKTVWQPVERNSTSIPADRLRNFRVAAGRVMTYSQCDRRLLARRRCTAWPEVLAGQFDGPAVVQVHVDEPARGLAQQDADVLILAIEVERQVGRRQPQLLPPLKPGSSIGTAPGSASGRGRDTSWLLQERSWYLDEVRSAAL